MTTTLAKARATQGRNPNNPRFFQINHPRVKKSAAADDAELSLVELLFQTGAQVVQFTGKGAQPSVPPAAVQAPVGENFRQALNFGRIG